MDPETPQDPRNLKTPYRVKCPEHGPVCLSAEEYSAQMSAPDSTWACPIDGKRASWDDDWYEAQMAEMGDEPIGEGAEAPPVADTDPKKIGEIRGKDNELLVIKAGFYPSHPWKRSVVVETEDGEPITVLSINTGLDHFLEEGEFIVNKDETEDFLHLMQMTGLFENTGKTASYGFIRDQPIWRIKAFQ